MAGPEVLDDVAAIARRAVLDSAQCKEVAPTAAPGGAHHVPDGAFMVAVAQWLDAPDAGDLLAVGLGNALVLHQRAIVHSAVDLDHELALDGTEPVPEQAPRFVVWPWKYFSD